MGIKFGLFDLFIYIIPGSLYIIEILYVYCFIQKKNILIHCEKLNLSHLLILAIFSYIVGHIFHIIRKIFMNIIFGSDYKEKKITKAFEKVKNIYPELKIKFNASQWKSLYLMIVGESTEITARIEWTNAVAMLLANVSFVFFIFFIIEVITFIFSSFIILHIMLSLIGLSLSIILILRSNKVVDNSFLTLFNAVMTLLIYSIDYT